MKNEGYIGASHGVGTDPAGSRLPWLFADTRGVLGRQQGSSQNGRQASHQPQRYQSCAWCQLGRVRQALSWRRSLQVKRMLIFFDNRYLGDGPNLHWLSPWYKWLVRYFTYYPHKIHTEGLTPERCGLVGFNVGQACFNLEKACVLLKECLQFDTTCRSCQVKMKWIPIVGIQ